MKYLTTLEVARELSVSKQTLLNWLHAKKVAEPPRNRNGHRLWSQARLSLIRQLIREGRLHRRTMVYREPSDDPLVVTEVATEVSDFLRDAGVPVSRFVRELQRVRRQRRSGRASRRQGGHSHGMSGISSRSTGRPRSRCEAQISSRSSAATPAYHTLSGWTATTGPRLQCLRQ